MSSVVVRHEKTFLLLLDNRELLSFSNTMLADRIIYSNHVSAHVAILCNLKNGNEITNDIKMKNEFSK